MKLYQTGSMLVLVLVLQTMVLAGETPMNPGRAPDSGGVASKDGGGSPPPAPGPSAFKADTAEIGLATIGTLRVQNLVIDGQGNIGQFLVRQDGTIAGPVRSAAPAAAFPAPRRSYGRRGSRVNMSKYATKDGVAQMLSKFKGDFPKIVDDAIDAKVGVLPDAPKGESAYANFVDYVQRAIPATVKQAIGLPAAPKGEKAYSSLTNYVDRKIDAIDSRDWWARIGALFAILLAIAALLKSPVAARAPAPAPKRPYLGGSPAPGTS